MITVAIDSAGPLLERVQNAARRAGLALVGARAVANLTKSHLIELDQERHQFGRHYYLQAAQSVASVVTGEGQAAITITQTGIRQRLFGGAIRAKAPRRYLTIPNNPEDSGKRAGEFHDLRFAYAEHADGGVRPALVRRASTAISFTRRKQKDGSVKVSVRAGDVRGGEVIFWLVRRVWQKPDPSVLPTGEAMSSAAVAAIRGRVARLEDRATGGAS